LKEIDVNELQLLEELGTGNFGVSYAALLSEILFKFFISIFFGNALLFSCYISKKL